MTSLVITNLFSIGSKPNLATFINNRKSTKDTIVEMDILGA